MGNFTSRTIGISAFLMLKLSIWSVSVLTDITGLAISPSLPDIHRQFPLEGLPELDLLVSLPNLFLIPFVIIVGKLAQRRSSVTLIRIGCAFFILSAVAYQFAGSFRSLLLISIMLGIGAGFVVPLAAQLPCVVFQGAERQRQMGICSGISNASQVLCTFLAGWLAMFHWHTAFWVYFIAIIPLLLSPFLKLKDNTAYCKKPTDSLSEEEGINRKELIRLMLLYFIVMFFNLQIPLNLPFLLAGHHVDTTISGSLIAIFFLVQALTAFVINRMVHLFKAYTMVIVLSVIAACLILFPLVKGEGWYYVLAACAGITGGTIEPLIWNKTATVTSCRQSTVAFGWLMSSCYLCTWATPYIINLLSHLLHDDKRDFSFFISGALAAVFTVFLYLERHSYSFGMKKELSMLKQKNNV